MNFLMVSALLLSGAAHAAPDLVECESANAIIQYESRFSHFGRFFPLRAVGALFHGVSMPVTEMRTVKESITESTTQFLSHQLIYEVNVHGEEEPVFILRRELYEGVTPELERGKCKLVKLQ